MADFIGNAGSTTAVTEQATLPAWYQEYLRGSINKANAAIPAQYTKYQGPRIAGPDVNPTQMTADITQGQDLTRQNVGQWTPGINTASSMTQTGGTYDPNTFASQFMNPYMNDVYADIARRSNQNLTQNILPGVNSTFTGGGQFGSSRNMDFINRAIQNQQDTMTGQMATAGQNAWDSSQKAYSDWGTKGIQAGQALGTLSQTGQAIGYKDAAAMDTIGRSQEQQQQANYDQAYKDFLEQQNWGKDQATWLAGIVRGLPQAPAGQDAVGQNISGGSPLAALAGGIGQTAVASQPTVQRRKGGLITLARRH